jgi:hypothetical protein
MAKSLNLSGLVSIGTNAPRWLGAKNILERFVVK